MAEEQGYWFEPPKMWMPFSREPASSAGSSAPLLPSASSFDQYIDPLPVGLLPQTALSSSFHQPPARPYAAEAQGELPTRSCTAHAQSLSLGRRVSFGSSHAQDDSGEDDDTTRPSYQNRSIELPTTSRARGTTRGTYSSYQFAKRSRGCRCWTTFGFTLSQEEVSAYQLVPKLIGRDGESMKRIAASCNAKLRIRGKGSRYLEVACAVGRSEADIPLQLFVGANLQEELERAREMVKELLDRQSFDYAMYRERLGLVPTKMYFECRTSKERDDAL